MERLRVEGFEVACVASHAEAVEEARRSPRIDLIIADYHLQKGQTGIEVIAAVRELIGKEVGAILVSGDTSSTLREVKADDSLRIVSKPIQADELLALMAALLPSERPGA